MSRATLGFSRVTHARTRQNPYPRPQARVFAGTGSGFTKTRRHPNPRGLMPPDTTNEPRKCSASVNRHCRAALRGSDSRGNVFFVVQGHAVVVICERSSLFRVMEGGRLWISTGGSCGFSWAVVPVSCRGGRSSFVVGVGF